MKWSGYISGLAIFAALVFGCSSSQQVSDMAGGGKSPKADSIRIANDSLEYEIIIYDVGFNNWLATQPPRGYYTQKFLENRNMLWVTEFNQRTRNWQLWDPNLYQWEINYDLKTDYGYEVNYLLYNYLKFFQWKYNQSFVGGRRGPRG